MSSQYLKAKKLTMGFPNLLFCIGIFFISLTSTGTALFSIGRTKYYKFVIEVDYLAPDNFLNEGVTINGQFPGPGIRVKSQDTLIIDVENRLPRHFAMHWHGILQTGTFQSDGVPNVTQLSIPPGGCYRYQFSTGNLVGTYWYHSHIGFEQIWALGSLIIEDNPQVYSKFPKEYSYYDDKIVLLSNTYHNTIPQIMQELLGTPFVQNRPRGLLINGKSIGTWDSFMAEGNGLELFLVQRHKTYRFRIICASIDVPIICRFEKHTLTVIEMDGIYIIPIITDRVIIYPAQRYSVLVKMDQPVGNYILNCQYYGTSATYDAGGAVISYFGASDPTPLLNSKNTLPNPGGIPSNDPWVFGKFRPNLALSQASVYPTPKTVDKQITVSFIQKGTGVDRRFVLVNDEEYKQPKIPFYVQVNKGVNIADNKHVFEILYGQSVQIIYNFLVPDFKACITHPMHLHGHVFWIVGTGKDSYQPERDDAIVDANIASGNIEFRDVAISGFGQTVANLTVGNPCGWLAIRFIADNPGIWMNHCHIIPHMEQGKMFLIWEHSLADKKLLTVSRKHKDPLYRCRSSCCLGNI